jgi:hypothetical protein
VIETSPSANDKIAAMAVHIAGIFFWFVPSLIVYFAVSGNPWLKEQARNALSTKSRPVTNSPRSRVS